LPTPAALPAFDPPYFLGGSAFIAVCLAHAPRDGAAHDITHSGPNVNAEQVRLRGLCVLVVADYTAPPAALPIAYCELIVAKLALTLRGLVSRPLVMRLDADAPVALGIEHYAMPKQYDPSLQLDSQRGHTALRGAGITLSFATRPSVLARLCAPLCALFTLGLYAFTRLVPVLSERAGRSVRARVVLHPRARAELVRLEWGQIGQSVLRPLLVLRLPRVFSELGAPSASSSEAP
jgi:hypothetical protein